MTTVVSQRNARLGMSIVALIWMPLVDLRNAALFHPLHVGDHYATLPC